MTSLSLITARALAGQVINVSPGQSYEVKASNKEMNAIEMKTFNIASAWATESNVDLAKDDHAGVITFIAKTSRPFPIFIRDEDGDTYNLLIQPESINAQLITLIPAQKIRKEKMRYMKNEPWKSQLKKIARSIANNTLEQKGYSEEEINREIPLWKEVICKHVSRIHGAKIIADKYLVSNRIKKQIILDEREFENLGNNVLSVGFLKQQQGVTEQGYPVLSPKEKLIVIVFRVIE